MNGYQFFCLYHPIHLHFTTKYDIFKYNKKVKPVTEGSFGHRKDSRLFEGWARRFNTPTHAEGFVVANFAYSDNKWIYSSSHEAGEIYDNWKTTTENIEQTLKHDFSILSKKAKGTSPEEVKVLFQKTGQNYVAPAIQSVLEGQISKESLCLIDSCILPCFDRWLISYSSDPLISQEIKKLAKYSPFLYYINSSLVKSTFMESVRNHE